MKYALVTYIYPNAEIFLNKFLEQINLITFDANLKIFIFNDGANISDISFNQLKFSCEVVNMNGTINEIRHQSFQFLKTQDIDFVLFQDIDDLFPSDRFLILKEKLRSYPLVCNDLKYMKNDKVDAKGYWQNRLGQNFEFDYHFIQEKNIIGLGNTAINRDLLLCNTYHSNLVKAYDWYYFYQVLRQKNIKALFTSETQTYYYQHENNIAGIEKERTTERLEHIKNVKQLHYNELIKVGYLELEKINSQLEQNRILPLKVKKNYFWWEEII